MACNPHHSIVICNRNKTETIRVVCGMPTAEDNHTKTTAKRDMGQTYGPTDRRSGLNSLVRTHSGTLLNASICSQFDEDVYKLKGFNNFTA